MHHEIQRQEVTSHGKLSVGLSPDSPKPTKSSQSTQNILDEASRVLTPSGLATFERWIAKYAPNDTGEDYDLLSAFLAGVKPDAAGHWPDWFKKPNHPTFSNESIYAVGENAHKAGRWDGDKFIPAGMPADCVPLISIEELADAIDDGNARKSWLLNKFFYDESRGADHTQTEEIVSSCASLREFLDLKTGQRAASAMNGGVL